MSSSAPSSSSAATGSSSSSSSAAANPLATSLLAAFHGSGFAAPTATTTQAGSSMFAGGKPSSSAANMTWASMVEGATSEADEYGDDAPYDEMMEMMKSEIQGVFFPGGGNKKQKLSKGGVGYGGDAASDKTVLLRGRQAAAQKEAEEDKKVTDYLLQSKTALTAYLDRQDHQDEDDDEVDAVQDIEKESGEKRSSEAMEEETATHENALKQAEEEKKEEPVAQPEATSTTTATTMATETQEKSEAAEVTVFTEPPTDAIVTTPTPQLEAELGDKEKPKHQDTEVDLTVDEPADEEREREKKKQGPEAWIQDLVRTVGKVFRNSVPTDWDQRLALYEAALECCSVLTTVPPPSPSALEGRPAEATSTASTSGGPNSGHTEQSPTTAEDQQPDPVTLEDEEDKRMRRRRQRCRRRHALILNGLFGDAEDAESLLAALDEFAQHATMMVSHAVDHEKPPADGGSSAPVQPQPQPQPQLPKKRGRKRGRGGKAQAAATTTMPTTPVGNVLPLAKRVLEVQNEAHEASKRAAAASQEEEEELLAVMDTSDYYRKTLGPLRFALVPELPGHYFANKEMGTPNAGGGSRAASLRSGGYRRSSSSSSEPNQVPRDLRRLFRELTSYQTCLPVEHGSAIFVRAKENRLDLLRALITGPEGTPYANGCLVFDIWLPPTYPQVPPQVHLMTTGGSTVRFNPNLYQCGKVCLSLLGTWSGPGWVPGESTLLQVLVSIQSLILVPDPYFNEPGYEASQSTARGQHLSEDYNRRIRRHTARWCIADFLQYALMGESKDSGATPETSSTTLPSSTITTFPAPMGLTSLMSAAAPIAPPLGRKNPFPEFTDVVKKHFRYKRLAVERQLMAWMELECGDDASAAAKFWFPVQNEIVLRLHTLAPSRPPPPPLALPTAPVPKTRTLDDGVIEVLEDDDDDDDDDVIEVVEPFDPPPTNKGKKGEEEQVVVEIDD